MGLQVFDEQSVQNTVTAFKAAQTTTKVTIQAWSAPYTRIDTLTVTNSDVIAHVVDLWILRSTVPCLLGSLSVPAGQGLAGTPALNLLTGCLPAGVDHINLTSSDALQASMEVTVTAAFEVDVFSSGGSV